MTGQPPAFPPIPTSTHRAISGRNRETRSTATPPVDPAASTRQPPRKSPALANHHGNVVTTPAATTTTTTTVKLKSTHS